MLADLPPEILTEIISYLPTASSVVSLAQTCRSLHAKISDNEYQAFRGFVLNSFPSIGVPQYWRDAARALTSRSRAWDRRAFVARVLQPDFQNATRLTLVDNEPLRASAPIRPLRQTIGYTPVIDCHETWNGGTWSERDELLAWGAGPKLVLRTKRKRRRRASQASIKAVEDTANCAHSESPHQWFQHDAIESGSADDDILNIHILRSGQKLNDVAEEVIVRRAIGSVFRLSIDLEKGTARKTIFDDETLLKVIDCIDVSTFGEPLMAVCHAGAHKKGSFAIYDTRSEGTSIKPIATNVASMESELSRKRCVKFLDKTRFAVAYQRHGTNMTSPTHVYEIREDGLVEDSISHIFFPFLHKPSGSVDASVNANCMTPLGGATSPGIKFLAGCSDGSARLCDLRVPNGQVAVFTDTVDDGHILSLLSVGEERFLAGSHQNACLKTFDLRWTGNRPYSYLGDREMAKHIVPTKTWTDSSAPRPGMFHTYRGRKDYNIFLAIPMDPRLRIFWGAAQHTRSNARARSERYRGSVYALSSPSTASPTVYAGIENHVLQLDFAASDDLLGQQRSWYQQDLGIDIRGGSNVLNLSAYDRPMTFEDQTPIKLRNQLGFDQTWPGEAENGWDNRWRIATLDRWRSDRA